MTNRLVIYTPGHSDVWKPDLWRRQRGNMRDAAQACAGVDGTFSFCAPLAVRTLPLPLGQAEHAFDNSPGVVLLLLERLVEWLRRKHPNDVLNFLFVFSNSEGGDGRDTIELRSLFQVWCAHQCEYGVPVTYSDIAPRVAPHRYDEAYKVIHPKLLPAVAGHERVTVVLGPGTPAMAVASLFATLDGTTAREHVEAVQLVGEYSEPDDPRSTIQDTRPEVLNLPALVGRQALLQHARQLASDWRLDDAAILLWNGDVDSPEVQSAALAIVTVLDRTDVETMGHDYPWIARRLLDLCEYYWARGEGDGGTMDWVVLFYMSLLIVEYLPAARTFAFFTEHNIDATMWGDDQCLERVARGASSVERLHLGQLFVKDPPSRGVATHPGINSARRVLTALGVRAFQYGERGQSWISPDPENRHKDNRRAHVFWLAVVSVFKDQRNAMAHMYTPVSRKAVDEYLSDAAEDARAARVDIFMTSLQSMRNEYEGREVYIAAALEWLGDPQAARRRLDEAIACGTATPEQTTAHTNWDKWEKGTPRVPTRDNLKGNAPEIWGIYAGGSREGAARQHLTEEHTTAVHAGAQVTKAMAEPPPDLPPGCFLSPAMGAAGRSPLRGFIGAFIDVDEENELLTLRRELMDAIDTETAPTAAVGGAAGAVIAPPLPALH